MRENLADASGQRQRIFDSKQDGESFRRLQQRMLAGSMVFGGYLAGEFQCAKGDLPLAAICHVCPNGCQLHATHVVRDRSEYVGMPRGERTVRRGVSIKTLRRGSGMALYRRSGEAGGKAVGINWDCREFCEGRRFVTGTPEERSDGEITGTYQRRHSCGNVRERHWNGLINCVYENYINRPGLVLAERKCLLQGTGKEELNRRGVYEIDCGMLGLTLHTEKFPGARREIFRVIRAVRYTALLVEMVREVMNS